MAAGKPRSRLLYSNSPHEQRCAQNSRLTSHESLVTNHDSPLQSLCALSKKYDEAHMTFDLLAIAAHPDDVELTCGGTLLKARKQGYKTGILDLTAGEMGTRGTRETRLKEADRAARILRVSHRENLGLPDAGLEVNQSYKVAVARRIR